MESSDNRQLAAITFIDIANFYMEGRIGEESLGIRLEVILL